MTFPATSYTDTSLTANTEYWYQIKIVEPGGTTTTAPLDTWTLAAAPTDLTVQNDIPTEVDLTWVNPGSSGTPFFLERSDDGGTTFAIITETAAGATAYQDTTVTDGISYV